MQREQEGWQGGVLTIFVPGRPWNPLNGGQRSYMKHARLRKVWRERTATRLLLVQGYDIDRAVISGPTVSSSGATGRPWPWPAVVCKRITFTVWCRNAFDSDNLEAVCKSSRDALKDMGVIQDDRPSAGHVFEYAQVTTRKAGAVHGIAVRIAALRLPDVRDV